MYLRVFDDCYLQDVEISSRHERYVNIRSSNKSNCFAVDKLKDLQMTFIVSSCDWVKCVYFPIYFITQLVIFTITLWMIITQNVVLIFILRRRNQYRFVNANEVGWATLSPGAVLRLLKFAVATSCKNNSTSTLSIVRILQECTVAMCANWRFWTLPTGNRFSTSTKVWPPKMQVILGNELYVHLAQPRIFVSGVGQIIDYLRKNSFSKDDF
jgi:hypothetical protein